MKEGGGLDTNGRHSDKRQLVLKCDLQERILDPALFGATLHQQMVRSISCVITHRDIDIATCTCSQSFLKYCTPYLHNRSISLTKSGFLL